jgi:hypothetical protein
MYKTLKLVNLTPHEINVTDFEGKTVTIPSSGIARVQQNDPSVVKTIETDKGTFLVYQQTFTVTIDGLPEPDGETVYVVSRMVMEAAKNRNDLICPGSLIRDEKGVVKGCQGFSVL